MIEECLSSYKNKVCNYENLFFNTNTIINKPLERIAKDILNCKMISPAAEIFFESKAKEWLSITIDAFLNKYNNPISIADNEALKIVANYIDDHYATSISQKTLEKISTMSGTKLKKLFKQKYQCTITEYTQRRRMNMAEVLLLNSSLKIQDIAEAVGYSSHSKFSTCFKKYKGMYPKDIKKYNSKKTSLWLCMYQKNFIISLGRYLGTLLPCNNYIKWYNDLKISYFCFSKSKCIADTSNEKYYNPNYF